MTDFITLQEILQVICKRWLIIGLTLLVTVTTFAIVTITLTPIYEANAVLLVKFGRQYIYLPAAGGQESVISRNREALFNTEIQILKSRELIERVIQSVGAASLYPELASWVTPEEALAQAVRQFYRQLSVLVVPDSEAIRVSFRHPQPDMTSKVVNAWVAFYQEAHLRMYSNPVSAAFLGVKVDTYQKDLARAEEAIQDFQVEHKILSLDDHGALLLRQREQVERDLMAAQHMRFGLQHKLWYLEKMDQKEIEASYATLQPAKNGVVHNARSQVVQLKLMRQRLIGQLQEINPRVTALDNKISLLEDFLKKMEIQIGESQLHQILQRDMLNTSTEVQIHREEELSLQKQLDHLDLKIRDYPIQQKQYRNLIRQRDLLEDRYKTSLKRYEEVRSFEEMDRQKISSISVIEEGLTPQKPIRPRKSANIAVGIFLGMGLGMGLAFWVDAATTPRAQRAHCPLPVRS